MTTQADKVKRTPFRWLVWGLISLSSLLLLAGSLAKVLPFSLVEVMGFVTGAVCVMLTVEENIWNYPLGLANNLVFIVLFWQARLYGDLGLQLVYIGLGVFGWQHWLRGGPSHGQLALRWAGRGEMALVAGIGVAATFGMTWFLASVNDAAPFLDALTTVLSLLAQYLLTRKAIQNWFLWMSADLLYIALFLSRGLYLTALLYLLFLALCVGGLRLWMARYRHSQATAAA